MNGHSLQLSGVQLYLCLESGLALSLARSRVAVAGGTAERRTVFLILE